MADELLAEFVNESREHLATIEADLLTIEEGGADIDEELVNKVFRAAHSIKGAAGFFGLTKVKELSHRAETVLDMLRSRHDGPQRGDHQRPARCLRPLRDMINERRPQRGRGHHAISSSASPGWRRRTCRRRRRRRCTPPSPCTPRRTGRADVPLPEVDFERARRAKRFVYAVDYDLIHDIERKGKNVLQVFRDLEATGEILDCALDLDAAGTLDDDTVGNRLPLRLVFSTVLEPDVLRTVVEMSGDGIALLFDPRKAAAAPCRAAVAGSRRRRIEPVAAPARAAASGRRPAPAAGRAPRRLRARLAAAARPAAPSRSAPRTRCASTSACSSR